MATFAPTRPVPAGAFFADLPLLPILGFVVPFGPHCIGPLMVVGHEDLGPACPGLFSLHLFTLALANTRRSSSARVFVHHWL
jgi:hypothetical protein